MCDDPRMKGLRGQKIELSGTNGGWYSMIRDEDANFHVNVRLTSPLPTVLPDRQPITGLSVLSKGHSMIFDVKNPYVIDTKGCPLGVSHCLADGGLRIVVDAEEVDDPLRFSRDRYVADGITVSASNLPAECRPLRGGKLWARM